MTLSLLLVGCAFPQQGTDTPDEIGGTYYVNGTDSRGSEYGGQLVITQLDTTTDYEMQWIITGNVQTGTGIWNGSTLNASWNTIEGFEPARGTVSYTLEDDGSLVGVRHMDGIDGVGYEEAFPVRLE